MDTTMITDLPITLTLPIADIALILSALDKLPFGQVEKLIFAIRKKVLQTRQEGAKND